MSTRILLIPSWYPSEQHPTAGIFIYQQVTVLADTVDTAVLYVREAPEADGPSLEHEGGIPVVRAQLRMPPAPRRLLGRIRAVTVNLYNKFHAYRRLGQFVGRNYHLPVNLYNKFHAYRRTGLAAYELLQADWGTPDIIHVQALWPAGLIARAIKRKYGIPYVVTERSEEYSAASELQLVKTPGMVPLVLRPLARNASRTIAVSRFLADRLVELGLAKDPVVIPNVVPVSLPLPAPTGNRRVISHVSVMGPAKNLQGLVSAMEVLRSRRQDFVLRLIGDGEMRRAIESQVVERQLGEFVEFTGRQSPAEVVESLGASAFTVVSSTHETFSVSAAESLMCGRPVLSTRCGGPEEFITPEVGRLVEAGSVDALVEGLDWMLDHFQEFDPQALHEYARSRFAPDVVAAQILEVYREVLGD